MDNKYKISYEETDKKLEVEIYGLNFSINKISNEMMNKVKEIMSTEVNDFKELYKYIDMFLGEKASEKINKKRKDDGYNDMDLNSILSIIGLISNILAKEMQETKSKALHNSEEILGNRQYRRRYNKYNRGRRRY